MARGPGERLRQYWATANEPLRSGASSVAVAALEAKLRAVLPADFRDYLSVVEGMEGGAWIGNEIEFWPIHRIIEEADEWGCFQPGANETLLPFADWLINSHAYAVRVSSTDSPIFIVHGGGIETQCADNFDEFVTSYVQDHKSIYGN